MDNNFWGYMLSGIETVADAVFGTLPLYEPVGLTEMVTSWMSSTPVLLYAYVNQFLNLSLVMLLLGVILVLETVRAAIAIWMWILKALPVAG